MKELKMSEPKCTNINHSTVKAVAYCSKCDVYFCGECEKFHKEILFKHAKFTTKDFSCLPKGVGKCLIHGYELNLFCPVHYALCCSKCNLSKSGTHAGCPVVPFDLDDNMSSICKRLETDITTLTEKVRAMTEKVVPTLNEKHNKVENAVAAVKAEIEGVFKKIRDALSTREVTLLRKVEEISEKTDLSSIICTINSVEEEVWGAVSSGQEALAWNVDEDSGKAWELAKRGCAVAALLERVADLEKKLPEPLKMCQMSHLSMIKKRSKT